MPPSSHPALLTSLSFSNLSILSPSTLVELANLGTYHPLIISVQFTISSCLNFWNSPLFSSGPLRSFLYSKPEGFLRSLHQIGHSLFWILLWLSIFINPYHGLQDTVWSGITSCPSLPLPAAYQPLLSSLGSLTQCGLLHRAAFLQTARLPAMPFPSTVHCLGSYSPFRWQLVHHLLRSTLTSWPKFCPCSAFIILSCCLLFSSFPTRPIIWN